MTPGGTSTRTVDPAELDRQGVFRLLTAIVVPRPIAWTSTVSDGGTRNLAPFSFFTVVSTEPPMLALTIEAAPGGGVKDTLRNLRTTGEFVVNTVSVDQARQLDLTGVDHAQEVDEFALAGVTPLASTRVRPPRVAEAGISVECVLHSLLTPGSDTLVIGEVVAFHIADELLTATGRIDVARLRPLGRVASRFVDPAHPSGIVADHRRSEC
ncbi:flavin reductase family protein [Streptomyces sp. NPDC059578]|uniref:flavin reductase family protein n=1 Tax=unclassified Streptomyces TaxID=2593676 RepID=UPI0036515785